MKEKFEKEKNTIVEGYVNSFLSSFKENKWSKYEESGMQYMHHPTVKPKMILYDFNNTVIPFVYDGSDAEYSEFSKSRGIWVERRNKFYKDYSQDENLKWNFHSLTIYPSGEYESEFIWDNQAHLDYLVLDIDTFFSFLYEEVPLYLDRNYHNDTLWDSIEIRISFQEGKIQPLKIVLKTGEITTDYAVLIQNITYDESIYLIKRFEDIYELTNNGELKGVLSPTWNTAIMHYQAIDYFDFKKQVSFE